MTGSWERSLQKISTEVNTNRRNQFHDIDMALKDTNQTAKKISNCTSQNIKQVAIEYSFSISLLCKNDDLHRLLLIWNNTWYWIVRVSLGFVFKIFDSLMTSFEYFMKKRWNLQFQTRSEHFNINVCMKSIMEQILLF